MGKLMERLVNERLIWWAEKKKKLHPMQNGFRRGRSCIENLVKITSDIKTALLSEEYVLAAFLDVASAYDNVVFHILKAKLRKMDCPDRIFKFINTWLDEREVKYIINNRETLKRISRCGLPQGAVLSSILYALNTNDITVDVDEDVMELEFADDIVVYRMGLDRKLNRMKIEEAVNITASNLELIGLDLEPRKTTLVEFSKSGFVDDTSIIVKSTVIPNIEESRFLGVRMDNQLKFVSHIQDCHQGSGLHHSTYMLYKSLVRSVSDYGCFVYAPTSSSLLRLKLERGQFLGLRTAMGFRNSTPTNVLVAEAKVDLLSERAMMLAKNFWFKIIKNGNPDIKRSISNLSNKEMIVNLLAKDIGQPTSNFEIWDMKYEDLTEDITIELEIGRSHSAKRKEKERRNLEDMRYRKEDLDFIEEFCDVHKLDNPLVIYTDGSKSEDLVLIGASVVFEENNQAFYPIEDIQETRLLID
ncbi:uncharacterized protein LOC112453041 [Temnothorax curvispinosus]|uniref:Uncharacterized protein LOC112453041 n=1 Tax=Temnothorax curvispinosus TaxID=300111 RepID=A0A6J1PIG0_9HYME|nr:uncharacterized protein LOC112453041 [Temnothorax curvispinosus]